MLSTPQSAIVSNLNHFCHQFPMAPNAVTTNLIARSSLALSGNNRTVEVGW
jgi:hypothetical protein